MTPRFCAESIMSINPIQFRHGPPMKKFTPNMAPKPNATARCTVRAAAEIRAPHWVNIVLGDVKRAISGAVKRHQYARCHLAETTCPFNRRFQPREMLPRLTRTMAICAP
jgi:hypothetical protein